MRKLTSPTRLKILFHLNLGSLTFFSLCKVLGISDTHEKHLLHDHLRHLRKMDLTTYPQKQSPKNHWEITSLGKEALENAKEGL